MDSEHRVRLKCNFNENPRVRMGIVWPAAGGKQDIFHKMKRYKIHTSGTILNLARASKGHFEPKSGFWGSKAVK